MNPEGEPFGTHPKRSVHSADTPLHLGFSCHVLNLPNFRYRATDASGVVENEICPVFTAVASGRPSPNPAEAMEVVWSDTDDIARAVHHTPWAFSPWFTLQVPQMDMYKAEGQQTHGIAES